ncbi:hypothetical protein PORCAN_1357 [Porphyromonas crevioricanis JCM 13913]|nr:hypothetical protein PORCAN_1357 [Porphyromonas crevioricanis JCM 13913]
MFTQSNTDRYIHRAVTVNRDSDTILGINCYFHEEKTGIRRQIGLYYLFYFCFADHTVSDTSL